MNREGEQRFTGWIEKENQGLQMNSEGEQRFTGWIDKENKGLQDE